MLFKLVVNVKNALHVCGPWKEGSFCWWSVGRMPPLLEVSGKNVHLTTANKIIDVSGLPDKRRSYYCLLLKEPLETSGGNLYFHRMDGCERLS